MAVAAAARVAFSAARPRLWGFTERLQLGGAAGRVSCLPLVWVPSGTGPEPGPFRWTPRGGLESRGLFLAAGVRAALTQRRVGPGLLKGEPRGP